MTRLGVERAKKLNYKYQELYFKSAWGREGDENSRFKNGNKMNDIISHPYV